MKTTKFSGLINRFVLAGFALAIALSATAWVPVAADLADVPLYDEVLAGDDEGGHGSSS